MEFHQCANVFPLMSEQEFGLLCNDIGQNGLLERIWIYDEKIIDGRNRYKACLAVGVEPEFREWQGNGSLVAFIVSLNLHRRHLSESQRGLIAARLANLEKGQHAPSIEGAVTQADAAELLNVSVSTVERAAKVLRDGVPELIQKVEENKVAVSFAATFSQFPKEKQKRLLKRSDQKLVSFATNLKVKKKLKSARHTDDICLMCNPAIEPTKENVLCFLIALGPKLGKFARYTDASVEEIEELDAAVEVREDYGKILLAIDSGYREFAQILRYTGLAKDILVIEIARLVDGKTIEEVAQGGKTAMARGATKKLYQRCVKPEYFSDDYSEFDSEFPN